MDGLKIKVNNPFLALMMEKELFDGVKEDLGYVEGDNGYEAHPDKIFTKDNWVTLREGVDYTLGTGYAGLVIKNYDGNDHDAQLVIGDDGYVRAGDSDTMQVIATREDIPITNGIAYFHANSKQFKTKAEGELNVGLLNDISSSQFVRNDNYTPSSWTDGALIFSIADPGNSGDINIDHVWFADGDENVNGEYHFVADSTLKADGNATVRAGQFKEGSMLLSEKYTQKILDETVTGKWTFKSSYISIQSKSSNNQSSYINFYDIDNNQIGVFGIGMNGDAVIASSKNQKVVFGAETNYYAAFSPSGLRIGDYNVASEALDVNGNAKVGSTSSSNDHRLIVNAGDLNKAGIEAYGNSQGTGYLYVGQSTTHGGGISYNGDSNPAYVSGEVSDAVTFYRRTGSANHAVFRYQHDSNKVYFNGEVDVANSVRASYFHADGATGFTCEPGNGTGLRFWNSDSFKIYTSASLDSTWGGQISTNENGKSNNHNMHFCMLDSTSYSRGFCFGNTSDRAYTHIINGSIYTKKYVEGEVPFVSGFTGIGTTRLDLASSCLTVDNLTVRQTMNVYELVVNQVRGTNGSLAITNSAKIDTVSENGGLNYTCTIDRDKDNKLYQPFRENDFVYSQTFTGKQVKYWAGKITAITDNTFSVELQNRIVLFYDTLDHELPGTNYDGGIKYNLSGISGNVSLLIEGYDFEGGERVSMRTNGLNETSIGLMSPSIGATTIYSYDVELQGNTEISVYAATAGRGTVKSVKVLSRNTTDIPEAGDVVHQRGSETDDDRKGFMYLTNSDQGAPYLDVSDGIDSATPQHNTRIRLGKLDGISGQSGYGIWGSNDGTSTDFAISSAGYARIAGWNFTNQCLQSPVNSDGGFIELNSANQCILIQPTADIFEGSVFMYHNSIDDWGLSGWDNNAFEVFHIGSKNQIANWKFNKDAIYNSKTDGTTTHLSIGNAQAWTSSIYGIQVGRDASNRIWLGTIDGVEELRGQIGGQQVFSLGGRSNSIAGWSFNENSLYSGTRFGANGVTIESGTTPTVRITGANATNNQVEMFYSSSSSWGLRGRANSSSGYDFQLGSTNQIAGWNFTNGELQHADGERYISISNKASGTVNDSRGRRGFVMYNNDSTLPNPNSVKVIRIGMLSNDGFLTTYPTTPNYGIQIWAGTSGGGNEIFRADNSGAKIAGFNFDENKFYSNFGTEGLFEIDNRGRLFIGAVEDFYEWTAKSGLEININDSSDWSMEAWNSNQQLFKASPSGTYLDEASIAVNKFTRKVLRITSTGDLINAASGGIIYIDRGVSSSNQTYSLVFSQGSQDLGMEVTIHITNAGTTTIQGYNNNGGPIHIMTVSPANLARIKVVKVGTNDYIAWEEFRR